MSNQINTGAPTKAVMTPIGNSAGATNRRAIVSASTSVVVPIKTRRVGDSVIDLGLATQIYILLAEREVLKG